MLSLFKSSNQCLSIENMTSIQTTTFTSSSIDIWRITMTNKSGIWLLIQRCSLTGIPLRKLNIINSNTTKISLNPFTEKIGKDFLKKGNFQLVMETIGWLHFETTLDGQCSLWKDCKANKCLKSPVQGKGDQLPYIWPCMLFAYIMEAAFKKKVWVWWGPNTMGGMTNLLESHYCCTDIIILGVLNIPGLLDIIAAAIKENLPFA